MVSLYIYSGQSAESCAGQVGGPGPIEADQGDEVPGQLLDLPGLASRR